MLIHFDEYSLNGEVAITRLPIYLYKSQVRYYVIYEFQEFYWG